MRYSGAMHYFLSLILFIFAVVLECSHAETPVVSGEHMSANKKLDSDDKLDRTYRFSETPTITLQNIRGPITITRGSKGVVQLKAHGPRATERIKIHQEGSNLTLTALSQGKDNSLHLQTAGGSVRVRSSGSGEQRITVNGHTITSKGSEVHDEPLNIAIKMPDGSSLEAANAGALSASLDLTSVTLQSDLPESSASFHAANVFHATCVGAAKCAFTLGHTARSTLKAQGASSISAQAESWGVGVVEAVGSTGLDVEGTWESLKVKSEGANRVALQGTVEKDFAAEASGASAVEFHGDVKGDVARHTSGASQIRIINP